MERRIRWVALFLVLAMAVIVGQLVHIQVSQAPKLNADSKNPRNAYKRFDNKRGEILASDGTVLARSVRVKHLKPGELAYYRSYPEGVLYSNVTGYASTFYGTAGVEYKYNTVLRLHSVQPTSIAQILTPPPPSTDNVQLSIVPSLQNLAQQELAAVPSKNKDGAVVVLDPRNGAILAMYSSPSFDPNLLSTPDVTKEQVAGKADFHTPDAEGFEPGYPVATYYPELPGSTFKVVTSTAVYNLKPSLANFTFPVAGCTAPNAIPQTNHQICNDAHTATTAKPCGGNLDAMLPQSCDPGYVMLGLALGGTVLSEQADLFGFNQVPPVDLYPVEKSHFPGALTLAPTGKLGIPGVALSAFGQQTVSATALQNAMVASGIADTGTIMTPHVMSAITTSSGKVVRTYKPTVYRQAASASAAESVKHLMRLVVTTPYGTAAGVGFTNSEQVAVKTGTAEVGNAATNTTDWMIGFAPASNPRIAIAVVVPYQAKSASGAEIAGPIVKAMLKAALALGGPISTATTTPSPTTTTSTTSTTLVGGTSSTTTVAPKAHPTLRAGNTNLSGGLRQRGALLRRRRLHS